MAAVEYPKPRYGKEVVGKRLKVQSTKDGSWRQGVVKAYHGGYYKHLITFDDGEATNTHLYQEQYMFFPEPDTGIEELLHKSVSVLWPDENKWYKGQVVGYDGLKHTVLYEDGDTEHVTLIKGEYKVLNGNTPYKHKSSNNVLRSKPEALLEQQDNVQQPEPAQPHKPAKLQPAPASTSKAASQRGPKQGSPNASAGAAVGKAAVAATDNEDKDAGVNKAVDIEAGDAAVAADTSSKDSKGKRSSSPGISTDQTTIATRGTAAATAATAGNSGAGEWSAENTAGGAGNGPAGNSGKGGTSSRPTSANARGTNAATAGGGGSSAAPGSHKHAGNGGAGAGAGAGHGGSKRAPALNMSHVSKKDREAARMLLGFSTPAGHEGFFDAPYGNSRGGGRMAIAAMTAAAAAAAGLPDPAATYGSAGYYVNFGAAANGLGDAAAAAAVGSGGEGTPDGDMGAAGLDGAAAGPTAAMSNELLSGLQWQLQQLVTQEEQRWLDVTRLSGQVNILQSERDEALRARDLAVTERDIAQHQLKQLQEEKATMQEQMDSLQRDVMQLTTQLNAERGSVSNSALDVAALRMQLNGMRKELSSCRSESMQLLGQLQAMTASGLGAYAAIQMPAAYPGSGGSAFAAPAAAINGLGGTAATGLPASTAAAPAPSSGTAKPQLGQEAAAVANTTAAAGRGSSGGNAVPEGNKSKGGRRGSNSYINSAAAPAELKGSSSLPPPAPAVPKPETAAEAVDSAAATQQPDDAATVTGDADLSAAAAAVAVTAAAPIAVAPASAPITAAQAPKHNSSGAAPRKACAMHRLGGMMRLTPTDSRASGVGQLMQVGPGTLVVGPRSRQATATTQQPVFVDMTATAAAMPAQAAEQAVPQLALEQQAVPMHQQEQLQQNPLDNMQSGQWQQNQQQPAMVKQEHHHDGASVDMNNSGAEQGYEQHMAAADGANRSIHAALQGTAGDDESSPGLMAEVGAGSAASMKPHGPSRKAGNSDHAAGDQPSSTAAEQSSLIGQKRKRDSEQREQISGPAQFEPEAAVAAAAEQQLEVTSAPAAAGYQSSSAAGGMDVVDTDKQNQPAAATIGAGSRLVDDDGSNELLEVPPLQHRRLEPTAAAV